MESQSINQFSTAYIETQVIAIIKNRVNENNFVDYKLIDYKKDEDGKKELIKDCIAMLNSEESFGRDKFIIFGIVDKTLFPKGIDNLRDDNEFQNYFELIAPRPIISTGIVTIEEKNFGFIWLNQVNKDRPYTLKEDGVYPAGTSFIRVGSTNRGLEDVTREKFIFDRYLRDTNTPDVLTKIALKNKMRMEEYSSDDLEGQRKIDPSLNNGLFVIGKNEFQFDLKFQAASNDIARIYNNNGVSLGKYDAKKTFDEIRSSGDVVIQDIDFSSRVVDFSIGDIAVIVNQYGKILVLCFKSIASKGHGALESMVEFEWRVLK